MGSRGKNKMQVFINNKDMLTNFHDEVDEIIFIMNRDVWSLILWLPEMMIAQNDTSDGMCL